MRGRLRDKLPADLLRPQLTQSDQMSLMWQGLGQVTQMFEEVCPGLNAFCELPLDQEWRSSLGALASVLHDYQRARDLESGRDSQWAAVGIKIRCGGVTAADIPTMEQIAGVLSACCDRGIPVKATAGLHHPIRHLDEHVHTKMHGFLNVFAAGALAFSQKITESEIREIVADENGASFIFADDALHWHSLSAKAEQIAEARRELIISFGSCSFDEPRADLKQLRLLP